MDFRFKIVEITPLTFLLTRQNIYSQTWTCGPVRAQTAREAASYAYSNKLAPIYAEVDQAIAALLEEFPHIATDAPELSFEPAARILTDLSDPAGATAIRRALFHSLLETRPSRGAGREAAFPKKDF